MNDVFRLNGLKKTYGSPDGNIPDTVFKECRLPPALVAERWRHVCGTYTECRMECPKMWSLSIKDLAIKANTMHGILGHSGSGKTTLLNMLALLDLPDKDTSEFVLNPSGAGEYRFNRGKWEVQGATGNIASSEIRKRHFGFVFQAGYLISALTAVQNVAMPLSLSNGTRGAHEKARTLLIELGIESHRLNALPRHLSGGEYQRVAVARAVAHNPDVVFADEPTGNLDPDTAVKTMDTLAKWQKEGVQAGISRTVVLVTHNVSQALSYCDNLTVLSAGKKVLDRPRGDCTSDDLLHAIEKRSGLRSCRDGLQLGSKIELPE